MKCESCGAAATVTLVDGSHWCFRCDASARSMGYDDTPIAVFDDGVTARGVDYFILREIADDPPGDTE